MPQPESKSPSSISQKTPTSLSRHGTLRASHRRKNSMTGSSLALNHGRRSPVGGFNDQKSPQGLRSPQLLSHDRLRSPSDFPGSNYQESRSPARSPTNDRRSPTFSIHTQDRRSPIGMPDYQRRSPTSTVHVQDGSSSRKYDQETTTDDIACTPTGFSHIKRSSLVLFTPIPFGEKRSPMTCMPIPPITVSNPTETCKIVEKMAESNAAAAAAAAAAAEAFKELEMEKEAAEKEIPEKKERTSVMREILAFVRKPSKHISTRNRFAAAFSRAESGSSRGPLLRQSTFSTSPAASSTAAKSAVTKQFSEVGFEPRISFKFALNPKMSLKLRRSTTDDKKLKDSSSTSINCKKSSGDEASGTDSDSKTEQVGKSSNSSKSQSTSLSQSNVVPFELDNVRFEKVGDSYIKHEQTKEESHSISTTTATVISTSATISTVTATATTLATSMSMSLSSASSSFAAIGNKLKKIVALSDENAQMFETRFERRSESREPIAPRISEEQEIELATEASNADIDVIRAEIAAQIKSIKTEPIYVNLLELRAELGLGNNDDDNKTDNNDSSDKLKDETSPSISTSKPFTVPLQCPTIEFEPPSRRSSFDPPRSPFLDNLRSPGVDTETDLIHMHRLDSGGDSFEMVDTDRNRESSFEERYSSRDTSFDISRYQSTSYEDQTSSFEIVDIDSARHEDKKSNIDLRKSSIELVDADTFQRSGSSGRKSSLETHFDYTPTEAGPSSLRSPGFPMTKKQKPDHFRSRDLITVSGISRARSPLSNQTSSNYSSRDSYDSSSSYPHSHHDQRSPYNDPTKQHFPLTIKAREEEVKTFLCTDKRCAAIFEPRPNSIHLAGPSNTTILSGTIIPIAGPSTHITTVNKSANILAGGCSSGSEFEPPSPRRAASASPKHTFTFRIVLKKVDSSPDPIFCPSTERRSRTIDRYRRRDSRRKRITHT